MIPVQFIHDPHDSSLTKLIGRVVEDEEMVAA